MSTRQRIALVAVVALVVGAITVGGTAAAYLRTTGSGTGAGATGTTVAVTLTPGAVAGDLYPGATATATVSTTASNPNAGSVRIESLLLDTGRGTQGFSVDAAHSGCPATSFAFVTQTNAGAGWTVPGNSSLAISLTGALTMSAAAVNACQGVVVTVFLKTSTP